MEYLYHYGPLRSQRNWQNLKQSIIDNKLFLSSPDGFNDPFDCLSLFSVKKSDEPCVRAFFAERYREDHPNAKENEPELVADLIVRKEWQKNSIRWKKRIVDVQNILKKQASCLRIYCFSELYNQLLMWAHYGDNHRGYCLIFKKDVLDSPDKLAKVEYHDYPTFTDYYYSNRTASYFMLRKSTDWEYEQEWRIVYDIRVFGHEDGLFVLELPEDTISGIILGCQMDLTSKEKIRNLVDRRKTENQFKIFEAQKSKDSYSIIVDGFD